MAAEKPFMCEMINWWREPFDKVQTATFYTNEDVGLGFFIRGTFVGHPRFGTGPGAHTSWVMSETLDADGNTLIETRNSRYKLIGEPWDYKSQSALSDAVGEARGGDAPVPKRGFA